MTFKWPQILAIPLSLLMASCGSIVQRPASPPAVADVENGTSEADYRVGVGDELELRFFYTPDLNGIVTVRPDGKISLPFIGDVPVLGLSVADLSGNLRMAYAPYVRRPEVSINIKTMASQRIYVGGEVAHPGVFPLNGSVSVLQAILLAEGMKDTAKPSEVIILRRGANNQRQTLAVNLDAIANGDGAAQDVMLRPYDVVLVPRSGIANVNQWIDLYIRRNLPINVGFSYTVNRYESTTK